MSRLLFFLFLSFAIISCNSKIVAKYPSSGDDMRFDNMQSVFGSDFVLTPTIVKNDFTKVNEPRVNQFLWDASLETLEDKEISYLDKEKGIIISNWYKDKGDVSHKIEIYIKDYIISDEAVNVRIYSKCSEDKNNNLARNPKIERDIKKEIIFKARNLYFEYTRKISKK